MKLPLTVLAVLFSVFVLVMGAGQIFSVQDTGDDLAGSAGTLFATSPTLFIIFGAIIAVAGLFAIISAAMRQ